MIINNKNPTTKSKCNLFNGITTYQEVYIENTKGYEDRTAQTIGFKITPANDITILNMNKWF